MKQITQLGATIEEAILLALQKLGVSRDQVEVEVLQEAKKGFLGFGARQAEVRITVNEIEESIELPINAFKEVVREEESASQEKEVTKSPLNEKSSIIQAQAEDKEQEVNTVDPIESAKLYLTNIAKEMGIEDLRIQTESEGRNTIFKLESEEAALLIGKRGSTLNALQQLTQLVMNKTAKTFMLVKLDVENYRERRQEALEQLAQRMADKAVRTGKRVSFEPMPSYERKVIHNVLANRIDIETYSEGIEPNRHLVINPIK